VRELAGDVDTIVLLALRKDPRRRYASVEALSEDIRRHLAGLPISARHDTLFYRGGKFVRRHSLAVAAAVVFVLLAVGATATMAVQRARIERERLKAEQISRFLAGLFRGSDPREARGSPSSVREMLDRGSARIERELAGEPEVQATLMLTIGRVYQELGSYESATRMMEGSYRIRRKLFGERSLVSLESLNARGELEIFAGRFADAERHLREAARLRTELLGGNDLAVAESLRDLAKVLRRRDGPASELVLKRVLAIQTRKLGPRNAELADTWNAIGLTALSRGNYEASEAAFQNALGIARAAHGRDHPHVVKYMSNLGAVLIPMGRFREAAAMYRDVSADQKRLLGEEHPLYAAALVNQAEALELDGRTAEAEALARQALAIGRKVVGPDHPDLAFVWNCLATILREKGDVAGSEAAALEAIRLVRPNLPPGHLMFASPTLALGWARLARGDSKEAERLLREGLESRVKNLRPGDWTIAEAQSLLGACLVSRGSFAEAESLLTKSREVQAARLGASHRHTRDTLQRLVTLYEAWGRPELARPYAMELTRIGGHAS